MHCLLDVRFTIFRALLDISVRTLGGPMARCANFERVSVHALSISSRVIEIRITHELTHTHALMHFYLLCCSVEIGNKVPTY